MSIESVLPALTAFGMTAIVLQLLRGLYLPQPHHVPLAISCIAYLILY